MIPPTFKGGREEGLRDRNSPKCTLSQNGYCVKMYKGAFGPAQRTKQEEQTAQTKQRERERASQPKPSRKKQSRKMEQKKPRLRRKTKHTLRPSRRSKTAQTN